MASFDKIPAEVLMLICEEVAALCRAAKTQGKDTSCENRSSLQPLAACSVVSKKWQRCIEPLLYKVMYISDRDIPTFASIVEGPKTARLGYVRHLRLNVILPDYECRECTFQENRHTVSGNNRLFTNGLYDMLKVLSTFDPSDTGMAGDTHGLTLELSAASPSDNEHMHYFYRCASDYPFRTEEDLDAQYRAYKLHHNRRLRFNRSNFHLNSYHCPSFSNSRALGSEPLTLDFGDMGERPVLPKIRIVRSLITRRQPLRQINPLSIGPLLSLELSDVRCLRMEPLLRNQARMMEMGEMWSGFLQDLGLMRKRHPERGLDTLSLFLSHNPECPNPDGERYNPEGGWVADMSEKVRRASFGLKHLSAAFIADAWWFFLTNLAGHRHAELNDPGNEDQALWPHLKTLALTTFHLRPKNTNIWGSSNTAAASGPGSEPGSPDSVDSTMTVFPGPSGTLPAYNISNHGFSDDGFSGPGYPASNHDIHDINDTITDESLLNQGIEETGNAPGQEEANEENLKGSQKLIILAGRAALEMPELQTMELWQACTRNESVLRYEAHPVPTVTFLGRFDMTEFWTDAALAVWEKVARRHTNQPLVVRFVTLPPWPKALKYHVFGAMKRLKLRDLIIDPVSYYGATWEEDNRQSWSIITSHSSFVPWSPISSESPETGGLPHVWAGYSMPIPYGPSSGPPPVGSYLLNPPADPLFPF